MNKRKKSTTTAKQGFEQMALMDALGKAGIFTESKRTQEYLQRYLAAKHYDGQLVGFSTTNNSLENTLIYQQWLAEYRVADKITA